MNWFLYCTWVSFCRVDLCHQAYDDDDYEGSFCDNPLLEKTSNESNLASIDSHRKCFPFRFGRVGNRQKIVILVWGTNVSYVVLIFTLSFSPWFFQLSNNFLYNVFPLCIMTRDFPGYFASFHHRGCFCCSNLDWARKESHWFWSGSSGMGQ